MIHFDFEEYKKEFPEIANDMTEEETKELIEIGNCMAGVWNASERLGKKIQSRKEKERESKNRKEEEGKGMQATKIMTKQDVMELLEQIETNYDTQPIGSLISTKGPDGNTAHNVLVLYTDKDLLFPKAETGGNIWMV